MEQRTVACAQGLVPTQEIISTLSRYRCQGAVNGRIDEQEEKDHIKWPMETGLGQEHQSELKFSGHE